jgi:membrane fusion protein (multidrug efflux system)
MVSDWMSLRLDSGLLALSFLVVGCGSPAQSSPEDEAPTALPVEVAAVERGSALASLTGTTTLDAEAEATVVARTDGVVTEVLVEEGQYVRAGQPLVQLDDERLALEVRRAEATLRELEGTFERTRVMYEKQLVSREAFDQARASYENQQVTTDLARLALAHATVRAPIAGWVSARHVKDGNMVRVHDPVFDLTNLDPLRAELHVPERELAKLERGLPATLHFDALPGQTFEGRVALISPVVDATSGTVRVTVEVRDPSRTIKPGMFARVHVQYDRHEDALLVPRRAVVEEDDVLSVYVVVDSLAVRRPIATGYSNGDRVEVTEGLSEGDRVVLSGQTALRDSALVAIVP